MRRHKTGFEFSAGGRFRRLTAVLDGTETFSLEDFARLQGDVQCPAAKALIARLGTMPAWDGAAEEARAMLLAWDGNLDAHSAPALLSEIWLQRHLIPAAMRLLSPPDVVAAIEAPDTDFLVAQFIASAPEALWRGTLAAAWVQAREVGGPDPGGWRWGAVHHIRLGHLLSPVLGPPLAQRLDLGPLPKGGSGLTVNNNGYTAADFGIQHGVAWRMLADVGNWDACRFINSPGQSGDPASPHYGDHFPIWARDDYLPLLFSRDVVEGVVERCVRLLPR